MAEHTLAVQYRPNTFSEVVGQEQAKKALTSFLRSGKFPPTLLLSGPSGTGKTTLARIAAAALLCPNSTSEVPCGNCKSCKDIADPNKEFPDLVELDASSHGTIDDIRALELTANTAPMFSKVKIIILDEAHGLTAKAQEAFLKISEEPPASTIFMLATTDPDSLIHTLRGRMLELQVQRPTDKEINAHIESVSRREGWDVPPPLAESVVASTDPSLGVRGALMTLQRISPALQAHDAEAAFTMLGAVKPQQLSSLWAAIQSSSTEVIFSSITTSSTSERTLARLLLPKATSFLKESLGSQNMTHAADVLSALTKASTGQTPLLTEILKVAANYPASATPYSRLQAELKKRPALVRRMTELEIELQEKSPTSSEVRIVGTAQGLDTFKKSEEIRELTASIKAAGVSLVAQPR